MRDSDWVAPIASEATTATPQNATRAAVRRSGARPGDILFVTGPLGTKLAGLMAATDPAWVVATGLSREDLDPLIAEYRAPPVPFADIYARIVRDHASAALDISDGLLIDLERLSAASGTGAVVEAEKLPLHRTVRALIDNGHLSLEATVTGGDDYVVLFSVPEHMAEAVIQAGGIARCHAIGKIVPSAQGVKILDGDGLPMAIGGRHGYDHFTGT